MRNSVIVLLGLICVFASAESIFSVNKQEIGVFTELQNVDGSDFGKKLLDTISLQLKNKAPLSDISKLLHDIERELKEQQAKANDEESRAHSNAVRAIADYEKRITIASTTIQDETLAITGYTNALAQYETQKAQFQTQINILKNREKQFRAAYKQDQDDHANRVAQQRAVIAALDQIIPELERLRPHGNVQTALVELAKIGRANPIGALLQVAMTLDAGALQRVIQHLQRLKKSVQASIADDDNAQRQAEANYKQMLEEFQKETNNLNEFLARTLSDIETTKSKKAASEKALENARKERTVCINGKKTVQTQDDERHSRYVGQKNARDAEIAIVQNVLRIIATRLANMQDYIAKRVNN